MDHKMLLAFEARGEEVQFLFCKNPRTPVHELQGVLPRLQRRRLQQLVQDLNVPPLVRKKAEALLGPACLAGSMGGGRA